MLSVHRLENDIRPRLDREVKKRHEHRHVAVCGNEVGTEITRMGGCVAQALQAFDFGQAVNETCEREFTRISRTVIGIYVLPEQGDFTRAVSNQPARLILHIRHRAGKLGAARIGHNAKGAEAVAAFLNGEKGADPGTTRAATALFRQMVKFTLARKFGIDHAARFGTA